MFAFNIVFLFQSFLVITVGKSKKNQNKGSEEIKIKKKREIGT